MFGLAFLTRYCLSALPPGNSANQSRSTVIDTLPKASVQ